MGTYLNPDQFADVPNAAQLIGELEAHLSLHYPKLATLTEPKAALLPPLLVPVIERWAEVGTGLDRTEGTGPFSDRVSGGGGHVLWPREIDDLIKLCADDSDETPDGAPLGDFPASCDPLFARRPW